MTQCVQNGATSDIERPCALHYSAAQPCVDNTMSPCSVSSPCSAPAILDHVSTKYKNDSRAHEKRNPASWFRHDVYTASSPKNDVFGVEGFKV